MEERVFYMCVQNTLITLKILHIIVDALHHLNCTVIFMSVARVASIVTRVNTLTDSYVSRVRCYFTVKFNQQCYRKRNLLHSESSFQSSPCE